MLDPWRLVFDPEWMAGLAVIAFDYWLVCRVLRRRGEAVATRRIAAFAVGLAIIAVALFSPIDTWRSRRCSVSTCSRM